VLAYVLVSAYVTNGWTALGDPTRRAIFERLAERPQAVTELASELPVSRPAVSQHLKVLKEAGLVVDRRAGKQRIYQLDPSGLGQLRAELERFWSQALAAYKTAVEEPPYRRTGAPDRALRQRRAANRPGNDLRYAARIPPRVGG
jgi:DNA-binding transcriptional ArsR family regulator